MHRRLLCLVALCTLLMGCFHRPALPKPPMPEVTVALPVQKQIQDYEDFTGRVDAIYTVDVRSRVTGYLVAIYFKDGAIVKGPSVPVEAIAGAVGVGTVGVASGLARMLASWKDGDLLYVIDPRPYEADLDKAKGNVERLLGQKELDQIQVERYTKLVAKGAASQQDLDVYRGKLAETLGSLDAARAQVQYATINLGFCYIHAPISGQISRTFLQIGNVINADSTLLTTIVSVDPMYAYFTVEETTYLRVKEGIIKGPKRVDDVKVRMGLANDVDRRFPLHGTLDFFNNVIDPLTGTITGRGIFLNPKGILKPGLFARLRVPLGEEHPGLLVAEQAIGSDQGQKYLYLVDADNKVKYQRVQVGQAFNYVNQSGVPYNLVSITGEGLTPKVQVIVIGLQRVRPGVEVKTKTKTMEELALPPDSQPAAKPAEKK